MSYIPALLRVKLDSIKIILVQCRAVFSNILSSGYGFNSSGGIIAMNKIHVGMLSDIFKQGIVQLINVIPTHMRDFETQFFCRLEVVTE